MAQQAQDLLGTRRNDNYIGVTCEGEVCCHLHQCLYTLHTNTLMDTDEPQSSCAVCCQYVIEY